MTTQPEDRERESRRPGRRARGGIPPQFEQALALHQEGQLARARVLYEGILEAQPRHFDALHLSGLIAAQTGNPQRAVELIGQALAIEQSAAAYNNLGLALQDLGQWDRALGCFDRAVRLQSDYAEAWLNRGVVLKNLKRWEEALASYDRAIAINRRYAEAYFNRGNLLKDGKQWEAALASYDEAIAIAPGLAAAYANRATVLHALKRFEAALASYDRAIELDAGHAEAYSNRGVLLHELKRFDAALASYDRAIRLQPEYAEAYLNRSFTALLLGDFGRGFCDYEWRWKAATSSNIHEQRAFKQPQWLGREPLAGARFLAYGEQGLGDMLQFCRYVTLLAGLGASVILEAPEALAGLLATVAGVSQLVTKGSLLPAFDYHCPLMSLPLAFQTSITTIPASTRYLHGPSALLERWHALLEPKTKPRIGLNWSGSPLNPNDARRSIALAELMPFLPREFEYFSLQRHVRDYDQSTLRDNPRIRDFGHELDFDATAALCDCLDLVISVDTSVAHLSAALGKPTWILLPFVPDWRWLLDRDDSPWYPTVRLYRQTGIDDWRGTLREVGTDLLEDSSWHGRGQPAP